jgi:hypothetical protein
LKKKIQLVEREALREGKGLLMLTGEVAKMGISLPCTDVVFLLSSNEDSADDIIQKMFRSLTESSGKKYGFIVDMNIQRIIKAMFEYDMSKDKIRGKKDPKPAEDRLTDILELCDWGYDSFIEDTNGTLSYEDIMKSIKTRVFSSLDVLPVATQIMSQDAVRILLADEFMTKEFSTMLHNKKSKGKAKKEILGQRGKDIRAPSPLVHAENENKKENAIEAEPVGDDIDVPAVPDDTKDSSTEDDKSLLVKSFESVLKTFMNSLIVRNRTIELGKSVTVGTLLEIFDTDKHTAAVDIECACNKETDCNATSNLYESVYCDLKPYSADHSPLAIRKLVDTLRGFLSDHPELYTGIQSYVDAFMKELELQVSQPPPQKGSAHRRRTFKRRIRI